MTRWIKDVDTGELFPVQDDFEYEIPEHLKTAECNHIDYEKTTRTTIEDLQNQLLASHNAFEAIRQEMEVTSVNSNEVYPETASIKRFDFDLSKVIITSVVIAVLIVFVVFTFKLISTNDININTSYTSEQQSAENQEQEQQEQHQEEQSETQPQQENNILNNIIGDIVNIFPTLLILFVTVGGLRLGIHILKHTSY